MSEPAFEFKASVAIPADHPALSGHFPDRPLVPAVVLLDWTAQALRERCGDVRITEVHSAKFLLPVLPEQAIEIQLTIDPARQRARFRLHVERGLAAQGELGFLRV